MILSNARVLSLMECQALGATLTSWQSLGSAWHDMQHHVKLGSWMSHDTYHNDWSHYQYGAGQGSGLAPLLWFLVSTAIYNMLDNIPVKATLHHTHGISKHEWNVDGCVEDTSLIMTIPVMEQNTHPPQYSVEGLTLLTKTSERALCVSRGELELSKCFWYLIQWL
jgi:hypothetical protein